MSGRHNVDIPERFDISKSYFLTGKLYFIDLLRGSRTHWTKTNKWKNWFENARSWKWMTSGATFPGKDAHNDWPDNSPWDEFALRIYVGQ